MTCKLCSDQIGLPAEWHPHSRLEAAGAQRAKGYAASPNQKLYVCKACSCILRKGRNTGWTRAVAVNLPAADAAVA